jgi:hypothetical protein
LNSWTAYFSIKKNLLSGSQLDQAYNTVGGRFIGIGPDPTGGDRITPMGIHPRNDRDSVQPCQTNSAPILSKTSSLSYKGAGWKCDEAIQGMMETDDFYGSEIVQVKTPTLYQRRFVLVGDAGYATGPTGTGTSLAILGAYILAGEIGKHRGDLAAGLKGYEKQMRPLINEMQKIPPLVRMMFAPQTAWGLWLRNSIFAFICWSRVPSLFEKFFGGYAAHSDDYKMPEYEWEA